MTKEGKKREKFEKTCWIFW